MSTLLDLFRRVADLERRLNVSNLRGTVHSVDAAAGTVRLDLGPDDAGGRLLSPPVPYAQQAGALKVHAPPSTGQQMTIVSPSGDLAAGVAQPLSWSSSESSPSQNGAENMLTFGDVSILLTESGVTITVGGSSVQLTANGLAVTSSAMTHNGTNVGATHVHSGVQSGPAKTSTPE
ncbi:phage baseplate assembly protein V [Marivivens aquimaris]|uniref:phage baseplate assembly protein V n=1 Tax=Marivivens aquimaris TaxID=2774876 RepID=UPI001880CE27|nr:phage baseplate assembly protein V [Marivivens aquimaris]